MSALPPSMYTLPIGEAGSKIFLEKSRWFGIPKEQQWRTTLRNALQQGKTVKICISEETLQFEKRAIAQLQKEFSMQIVRATSPQDISNLARFIFWVS